MLTITGIIFITVMKIIIKMTKGGSLGHLLCWWEAGRRLSTGCRNYFSSKTFALTTSDEQFWTGLGQAVRILRTTFAEQASESPHPYSPPSRLPSPSSPSSSPSPSTPASPARWGTSTSSAVDRAILCSSCGEIQRVLGARAADFKEGLALLTLDTALDPYQGDFIYTSITILWLLSTNDAQNLLSPRSDLKPLLNRERARLDRILKMKTVRMTALMAFCFTICQVGWGNAIEDKVEDVHKTVVCQLCEVGMLSWMLWGLCFCWLKTISYRTW